MRIIAGTFRGRVLTSGKGLSIRPATDRARQTIFDILANRRAFEGCHVLDLFSGTGSLGLESLSRGAADATFVDSARSSLEVLQSNIRALGCEDRCTVYRSDVFRFLKTIGRSYDLVFADPPYRLPEISLIPEAISTSPVVHPGSLFVMEHPASSAVTLPSERFSVTTRRLGQTMVVVAEVGPPPNRSPDQRGLSSCA